MDKYHTISINRKGAIAHDYRNRAWTAIERMHWNHNTPEHTVNWSFQWNPDEGDYPGAENLPNPQKHYEPPPANVIRKADKHFELLKRAHEGDLDALWWFMPYVNDFPVEHIAYSDVPLYLALHSDVPFILWFIAEHTGIAQTLYWIIDNPHTSPGTIEFLMEDPRWKERCKHIEIYLNDIENQHDWIKMTEYALSQK